MFFGWGQRVRTWATPDGRWVTVTYSYLHLMFVFRAVFGQKWYLLEHDRRNDRRVSRSDVAALFPDGNAPQVSFVSRYLGLFVVGLLAILVAAPSAKGADDSFTALSWLLAVLLVVYVAGFAYLAWRSHELGKRQPSAAHAMAPITS